MKEVTTMDSLDLIIAYTLMVAPFIVLLLAIICYIKQKQFDKKNTRIANITKKQITTTHKQRNDSNTC